MSINTRRLGSPSGALFVRAAALLFGASAAMWGVVQITRTLPAILIAMPVCGFVLHLAWRAFINGCRLKLAEWRWRFGR